MVAAAAAAAAAQCIEVLRLQVRPLGGVWWRGEETTAPHCHNATTQPSNLTARILNTSAIREGILSFSPIASLWISLIISNCLKCTHWLSWLLTADRENNQITRPDLITSLTLPGWQDREDRQDNISDISDCAGMGPRWVGSGPATARLADVPQLKLNSFQNSGFSTIGNSINWFLVAMLAVLHGYTAPQYSSPDHLLQFTYLCKTKPSVGCGTVRVSFTTTTDNRLGISYIYLPTKQSVSFSLQNHLIIFCLSKLSS